VKVCVPGGIPETVVVVPVPVEMTAPGFLVSVHVPVEGSPINKTLPVAIAHVGWVIVLMVGTCGVCGWASITIFSEAAEMQPEEFVTVKVYVPGESPVTVKPVPVPVEVTPPGERVRVHVPEEGKPASNTLPVATAHVGWVYVPADGAAGLACCALITTLAEVKEIQPDALVTVKVYDPEIKPETVVLVPVPFVVIAPGLRVSVQVPVAGNPLRTTLPVETVQVGWVIVPTTGTDGVALTVRL
jgi:hypothetical protein